MIAGEVAASEEMGRAQQDALLGECFPDVCERGLHESVRESGFPERIFHEEAKRVVAIRPADRKLAADETAVCVLD